MLSIRVFSFVLLNFIMSFIAQAEDINVAVASNFMAPMKEIASEFEKLSGHRVKLSFGSSGKIFAQIINGAPFQLFFSADQIKPQRLEQSSLTVKNSRFTYAIGALALWASKTVLAEDNLIRLQQGNCSTTRFRNEQIQFHCHWRPIDAFYFRNKRISPLRRLMETAFLT